MSVMVQERGVNAACRGDLRYLSRNGRIWRQGGSGVLLRDCGLSGEDQRARPGRLAGSCENAKQKASGQPGGSKGNAAQCHDGRILRFLK